MIATMAARPLVQKHQHRRSGRLSLTPLIDCVFILLVFFMLQTNFLRPQAIEFSKSAGASGAISDLITISVEIHTNGSIWLNGEMHDIGEIREYAAGVKTPANARVILTLDPDVLLQQAVNIIDLFNDYKIENISMTAARNFDKL
jgi:biopolymer transport protein ExbD